MRSSQTSKGHVFKSDPLDKKQLKRLRKFRDKLKGALDYFDSGKVPIYWGDKESTYGAALDVSKQVKAIDQILMAHKSFD